MKSHISALLIDYLTVNLLFDTAQNNRKINKTAVTIPVDKIQYINEVIILKIR